MTRCHFLLLLLGMYCCSCNKLGSSHLPRQKMEDVLLDISLAETYSIIEKSNTQVKGSKNTDSLAVYYKEILAHHNVSREDFTQSMDWYKSRPDEMDTLYTEISARAEKMQNAEVKKNPNNPAAK